MVGVYRNLDLSDTIFDSMLTAMAKVQPVDGKASFLLLGDVYAQHEEWLGYSTTNLHGRAARDFASALGSEQMVTGPTDINGVMFDLVLTHVIDVVGVRFGSPVRTLYHSVIFIDVVLEQPIPHLVCGQEFYLKNAVDWELVRGDVSGLNWNGSLGSLARHHR